MDSLHRVQHQDTRTGHDCRFCQRADPEFGKREPLDRLVCSELSDTATAHMTENGYILHRMLEVRARLGTGFRPLSTVA